ncbi:MAG: transglycosylase domain-containing protein, partial [Candidatus Competibacteraceae bacterium]|nr:transglycosylase domain-containing protein [Candidatus Competibacteraceae bacterium]
MKPSHRRSSRSRSRRRQAPAAKPRRGLFRTLLSLRGLSLLAGLLPGGVGFGTYVLHLNDQITSQFEGKRWALPARVYARPLELYAGLGLSPAQFERELAMLHYRAVNALEGPGTYVRGEGEVRLHTRGFTFWDGAERSRPVQVEFQGGRVSALEAPGEGGLGLLRLEAAEIAGIYPSHHEDRILVRYEEIPPVLVDALIAVEDRKFHEHFGIDPKGIFRAFMANLQAGRTVQGGSTLTQQLVKNYFLTNERTYRRKFNEMIMAMLLEWHYSKEEILQAYANEVYLGQDGDRAIHGIGLASQFYFGRPLTELELPHVAL